MTHRLTSRRILWLLLLALALRVGYVWATGSLGQSPPVDYREYVVTATRLLEHGTITSPLLPDSAEPTASNLLPPAYTLFVACVYRVFGVESVAATVFLHLVNALATTLAAWLVFRVTDEAAGRGAAWVAAFITAFNPLYVRYVDVLWDTSLFVLGVAITLWFAWRIGKQPRGRLTWIGYGLWLGALAMLNPSLTIAYPFFVLWPASRMFGWRVKPISGAVLMAVLGWVVVVTPWTIRNYVHFDRLSYIRGGLPLELWLGFCPEADTNGARVYDARYPLRNAREARRIAKLGEAAYIDQCGRDAMQAIRADRKRAVELVLFRATDYWLGTVYSHAQPGQGGWPTGSVRAMGTLFLCAELGLFVLMVAVGRSLPANERWLAGIVLVFSLTYCLTHVEVRYRAPAEPVLAVLIGGLAHKATTRRKSKSGGQSSACA